MYLCRITYIYLESVQTQIIWFICFLCVYNNFITIKYDFSEQIISKIVNNQITNIDHFMLWQSNITVGSKYELASEGSKFVDADDDDEHTFRSIPAHL